MVDPYASLLVDPLAIGVRVECNAVVDRIVVDDEAGVKASTPTTREELRAVGI